MADVLSAVADFITQPFGAVGAACIMLAVTVINSQWLRRRLGMSDAGVGHWFNGLNLVGGVCLFVNAMIRNEVVWLVLETYFVLIAMKGIVQSRRSSAAEEPPNAAVSPHAGSAENASVAPQSESLEQGKQLVLQGFDTVG